MGLRQDEDYIMDALVFADKLKDYLTRRSLIKAEQCCQEIIDLISMTEEYKKQWDWGRMI